ncbi:unnamed protein product, partial [Symbiodinium sp. KB8]
MTDVTAWDRDGCTSCRAVADVMTMHRSTALELKKAAATDCDDPLFPGLAPRILSRFQNERGNEKCRLTLRLVFVSCSE